MKEMRNKDEEMKMNNSSSSGFGKISKSKGKANVNGLNYIGRSEKIDPDLYYTIYDQNISLKKKVIQLEQEKKKLSTQNRRQPNQKNDEESKSNINIDKNTLLIQNENLKTKNKRLNEKIKALEKYMKEKKPRPYMHSQNSGSSKRYPNIYQVNDYEKIITALQKSLKEAHEDRRKLIDDLNNVKDSGASRAIIEYSENIKDKNLKLTELSLELDKLKEKFESNEKILKITNQTLGTFREFRSRAFQYSGSC